MVLAWSRTLQRRASDFEKAADKNPDNMTYVGDLYTLGRGLAQDYPEARAWYEKGAAKGNLLAKERLQELRGRRLIE